MHHQIKLNLNDCLTRANSSVFVVAAQKLQALYFQTSCNTFSCIIFVLFCTLCVCVCVLLLLWGIREIYKGQVNI
jgi:hypothetical protein